MAITKSLHAAGYAHGMMNDEGARFESGKLKISVYNRNWPASSYYLINLPREIWHSICVGRIFCYFSWPFDVHLADEH